MKYLVLIFALCAGCSPITPEIIRELKDDHSSITIKLKTPTPWGLNEAEISRTNPAVIGAVVGSKTAK
jgi:hypothetical protein